MKSEKVFYGWFIVVMASAGNFMATGTGFYVFNAFILPLCEARGWSRTELNAAPLIASVIGMVTPMIYGRLIRKVGPRRLMTVGAVVAGIAFAGLGRVRGIWEFYLLFILLGLGNAGMSGMVVNAALCNWFVRRRGQAMGIATAASSASGVVLPYLALLMLGHLELHSAFLVIGAISLLISPAAFLIVKNRPEDHGLVPDGRGGPAGPPEGWGADHLVGQSDHPVGQTPSTWTLSQIIRTGAFWKTGFAYGLAMMGIVGVMFQLAPRFSDLGFAKNTAMAMMAATALTGTIGKYVWGMLCDRIDPTKIGLVIMILVALGLALALLPPSLPSLVLFILIFGFAMGGAMSTFPIMIAHLFGREAFPTAASGLYVLLSLQGLGYIIMGQSFDRTGSYNFAYAVFIALTLIAAALIAALKRPNPGSVARSE